MQSLVFLTLAANKLYSHAGVTIPLVYLDFHISSLNGCWQIDVLYAVCICIAFKHLMVKNNEGLKSSFIKHDFDKRGFRKSPVGKPSSIKYNYNLYSV